MKVLGVLAGILTIAFAGWLLAWPTGMSPVAFMTPPNPGFSGAFDQNNILEDAVLISIEEGEGPEDVVRNVDGLVISGLTNGWIIGFSPEDPKKQQQIAFTGGRPNGLDVDSAGNIIVADNSKGLLSIDRQGGVSVLVDSFDGEKFLFVNDVSVAKDGKIWFTDSSQRFPRQQILMDFMEGRSTGRLFSFDPETNTTELHLEALRMANGVSVAHDENSILVCETFGFRVLRYWFSGERKGTFEPFIENLPALPDNISYDGKGTYWVGLVSPRREFLDNLSDRPLMREALFRIGKLTDRLPDIEPYGWVIGIDQAGKISHNFQDPSGRISPVTSANVISGRLYLGSLEGSSIAVIDLLEE